MFPRNKAHVFFFFPWRMVQAVQITNNSCVQKETWRGFKQRKKQKIHDESNSLNKSTYTLQGNLKLLHQFKKFDLFGVHLDILSGWQTRSYHAGSVRYCLYQHHCWCRNRTSLIRLWNILFRHQSRKYSQQVSQKPKMQQFIWKQI